jgi:hypothetical protein
VKSGIQDDSAHYLQISDIVAFTTSLTGMAGGAEGDPRPFKACRVTGESEHISMLDFSRP